MKSITVGPTNIESLPDEVLLKILVEHLSAEEIHESARPVCLKWFFLTSTDSFIYSHLRRTEHVLLFQKTRVWFTPDDALSLALRPDGRVEMTSFRLNFRGYLYLGGCNGLMLGKTPAPFEGDTVYIANPITNQSYVLPPTRGSSFWMCCIAFAAPSMVHKVVAPCTEYCRVFTVGVDTSWRSVSCAHLTNKTTFIATPLVTGGGGFVHWWARDNIVLTMDVETEIIKETPLPFPEVGAQRRAYLSTGKCLSLLVSRGEYLWQVWELESQTGEWRMVMDVSLEAWKSTFERIGLRENEYIAPIGWLMYPQVLVFAFSNGCEPHVFPYNLVTRNIDSIKLPEAPLSYTCFLHQSSLVRF